MSDRLRLRSLAELQASRGPRTVEMVTRWVEDHPALAIPRPGELACDDCGAEADSVHWLPWITPVPERCVFACKRHDPFGYWLYLRDFQPQAGASPAHHPYPIGHLLGSHGATLAVVMLLERIEAARR